MTEGLKPCPFCGDEAKAWWGPVKSYNRRGRGVNGIIYVKCEFCGAQAKAFGTQADDVEEVSDDEWEKAVNAWNRRA